MIFKVNNVMAAFMRDASTPGYYFKAYTDPETEI